MFILHVPYDVAHLVEARPAAGMTTAVDGLAVEDPLLGLGRLLLSFGLHDLSFFLFVLH